MVRVEDLTTEMLEHYILSLPQILESQCLAYAATSSKSGQNPCTATISKLSLPMLSYILPILVQDAELTASVVLVDVAMQTLPHSPLLQSWHDTVHIAAAQKQPDVTGIRTALQPFVPTDASSMADVARLQFHVTGTLDELNKVLEMFPQDASYATNLAKRGCMKICYLRDWAGGSADLKAADQISPIQDFHQLKLLAEFSSNADSAGSMLAVHTAAAYAVNIYDRMLCLKPATYPARLAYERTFQQRGACKGTLGQNQEALEDLRMALKLGDENGENANKTLAYMSKIYLNDAWEQISTSTKATGNPKAALAMLDIIDAACAKEPKNQALRMARQEFSTLLKEAGTPTQK